MTANPKCRITTIGTVVGKQPFGWTFDCDGKVGAIGVKMFSDGRLPKYAGWSVQELTLIAGAKAALEAGETTSCRCPKGEE